jgi:hypothetical protein
MHVRWTEKGFEISDKFGEIVEVWEYKKDEKEKIDEWIREGKIKW